MPDLIHTSSSADEAIVLFDLGPSAGSLRSAAGVRSMELAAKSAQGLGQAMGTIQALANRTTEAIAQLPQPPAEFELAFGLKIDAEAGALVVKGEGESHLRVKLVWRSAEPGAEPKASRPA
jgi:Trypsin-co-occurring domain 1